MRPVEQSAKTNSLFAGAGRKQLAGTPKPRAGEGYGANRFMDIACRG